MIPAPRIVSPTRVRFHELSSSINGLYLNIIMPEVDVSQHQGDMSIAQSYR
jgi:hypothetical protein